MSALYDFQKHNRAPLKLAIFYLPFELMLFEKQKY